MKIKKFQENETNQAPFGEPTDEQLEKISKFTLTRPRKDDIFVYSVVLCDNEIDRDGEMFNIDALKTLGEMFVGVTGISDHSGSSDDQNSRIFDTELMTDEGRKTSYGSPYSYLKAHCYTVRSKKNEDFIREIECGIKKEISVGCSVKSVRCSVCGKPLYSNECAHRKGQMYDGQVCCGILSEPTDAYEWSFVAVPSQRNAGVTKKYEPDESTNDELKKQFELLSEELERLKGIERRQNDESRDRLKRLMYIALPGVKARFLTKAVDEMTGETVSSLVKQLEECELKSCFKSRLTHDTEADNSLTEKNNEFIIG